MMDFSRSRIAAGAALTILTAAGAGCATDNAMPFDAAFSVSRRDTGPSVLHVATATAPVLTTVGPCTLN